MTRGLRLGLILDVTPTDLTDRFWSKVDKTAPGGCWVWTGSRNTKGYGLWGYRGVARLVHRVAYEALVGLIPPTLVIDHLCRNTSCCNPAHLEAVTTGENTRRSPEATKAHCKRGHPLSGPNLIIPSPKSNDKRRCRECTNQWRRDYRSRLAAERAALKAVAS